jgi:hypothetical protein
MTVSVGIGVGADRVRMVALRGGRVVAASETDRAPGQPLDAIVAEQLASVPLSRFPRPRIVAALGPSLSQTRRVGGLPPLDDARLVERIIREGAGKFFLRNGTPLLTTGVRLVEPGTVWCAALDDRTVREVEAGCRGAGHRLTAVVPAAVVLGGALAGGHHYWTDGDSGVEVMETDGGLDAVRRFAVAGASEIPPRVPIPGLAVLGDDAERFADAYGAAVLPRWEPMAYRPGVDARGDARVPAWRVAAPAAALVLALAAALAGPALRAMDAEEKAVAALTALQDRRRAAADTERELERVSAALAEVAAFDANRYSPTLLMADVAAALPPGAAMVAFRADSTGGSIVALAIRAAAVVPALEKVPGMTAPEIVGPVTRETAAGREVERATIRFGIASGVVTRAPAESGDAASATSAAPRPGSPPRVDAGLDEDDVPDDGTWDDEMWDDGIDEPEDEGR